MIFGDSGAEGAKKGRSGCGFGEVRAGWSSKNGFSTVFEHTSGTEAVGVRLLYLPPYYPDFNPIENMWSKIKQILRSQIPRAASELIAAAKVAFQAITSSDCHGFFSNAKYAT